MLYHIMSPCKVDAKQNNLIPDVKQLIPGIMICPSAVAEAVRVYAEWMQGVSHANAFKNDQSEVRTQHIYTLSIMEAIVNSEKQLAVIFCDNTLSISHLPYAIFNLIFALANNLVTAIVRMWTTAYIRNCQMGFIYI